MLAQVSLAFPAPAYRAELLVDMALGWYHCSGFSWAFLLNLRVSPPPTQCTATLLSGPWGAHSAPSRGRFCWLKFRWPFQLQLSRAAELLVGMARGYLCSGLSCFWASLHQSRSCGPPNVDVWQVFDTAPSRGRCCWLKFRWLPSSSLQGRGPCGHGPGLVSLL